MDVGIFAVPFRLPETGLKQGLDWDIEVTQWAEQFGFAEAWYAEHYTLGWENTCAPELVVAAAARHTSKIKLAIGANLLPYHNPIALAHRLMQLDHMTGGRLIAGFGSGGYETDAQLFSLPDLPERRNITSEAIDVILDIWTRERPYKYQGKYFKVDYPAFGKFWGGPVWRPAQKPHPPVAIAGISASSSSLKEAGRRGFIPMSFDLDAKYLLGHWQAYEEGAKEAGRTPRRADWRLFKTVVVGRTDAEAVEIAIGKPVTRVFDEFVLRVYEKFGLLGSFAPGVPERDITAEYLARNVWLVGSVDTVVKKIEEFHRQIGGFGVLVTPTFDFFHDAQGFKESLRLLGQEVKPRLQRLPK
jgi:alkanesulfonate monooxygenase SsuD/methylene tetrahydromethanopterin reductase-like flavin-dependent oxidoreductase (luciferase family)